MIRLAKVFFISMLVSGLMFANFIGCSKTEDDESQLPALPPDSSMSIDFSAFEGGEMAPSAPIPGKNFRNAAARVLIIDAAVIVTLAPSVTVFKAAKSTAPIKQEDGSWVWKYSIAYLGNEYKAELTGRVQDKMNMWSMRITCPTIQPPLTDFEWYTGECADNNTSGSWRFFDYKLPAEAKEIGTIEWSVSAIKESKIVFTSKNSNSDIFNDVLTYSLEGTTATISYFDSSENITADITWDVITGAGSIKAPNYNNGERAYWDENKQDVIK